ncbi:hypothetical protein [Saccharolobus solfataricus]|uniref:hypothetical protein n=1 Tax=Saccharolobus solfataricus TaxID=2287 RepID=UPI003B8333AF
MERLEARKIEDRLGELVPKDSLIFTIPGIDEILGCIILARAFSNKPFGQTSSIVSTKVATWVLSTHVAIRGRAYLFRLIRPIIIPNTPNNPCQLPSQSSVQLIFVNFITMFSPTVGVSHASRRRFHFNF